MCQVWDRWGGRFNSSPRYQTSRQDAGFGSRPVAISDALTGSHSAQIAEYGVADEIER